jgi:hypothetical protein
LETDGGDVIAADTEGQDEGTHASPFSTVY